MPRSAYSASICASVAAISVFGAASASRARDRQRFARDEQQRFDRALQSQHRFVQCSAALDRRKRRGVVHSARPVAIACDREEPNVVEGLGLLEARARRRRTSSSIARKVTITTSRVIPVRGTVREKYTSPFSLIRAHDVIHRGDQRDALARDRTLLRARLRQHRDECALELLGIDLVALHDLARSDRRLRDRSNEPLPSGAPRSSFAQFAVLRVRDQPAAQSLLDLFGRLAFARRRTLAESAARAPSTSKTRSVAAITRYSAAISKSSACIARTYARYCSATLASGTVAMSSCCSLISPSSRSSGPSKTSSRTRKAVAVDRVSLVGLRSRRFRSASYGAVRRAHRDARPENSSAISTSRFSLTYLSVLRACAMSNQRASSTS